MAGEKIVKRLDALQCLSPETSETAHWRYSKRVKNLGTKSKWEVGEGDLLIRGHHVRLESQGIQRFVQSIDKTRRERE